MKRLICILGLLLTSNASIVFASSDTRVFPEILELELGQDEMVTEQVSLAVIPTCIVPIDVDVVASDPNARVTNLTGVLTNGCNRSVSSFDIEFTGTGASQAFDLQFVNAQSGRVMDAIPVTITPGRADSIVLVEGHVFNLRSGTPIQGALVRATARPVAPSTLTDENGFYSLEVNLGIHDFVNAQCRIERRRDGTSTTYSSSSPLPTLDVDHLRRDFYLDVQKRAEPIRCLPAIVPLSR